ncbi:MAG: polyprenyl synthetase family protein [Actinomycetaceae bacterium]|nr:polyprenyl synthetase family protein [Actinomycetaceae bacterium]
MHSPLVLPSNIDTLRQDFRNHVEQRLGDEWLQVFPHAQDKSGFPSFTPALHPLVYGGKRMRAWGVALGFILARTALPNTWDQGLLDLACAVELFQSAALVHDDVIDRADTRRNSPSAHRVYETLCDPPSEQFGQAAAIVAGDFLLSCAYRCVHRSALGIPQTQSQAVFRLFDAMSAEVAFGQFIDMWAEKLPLSKETPPALDSALTVVESKSAHYSAMYPLLLGAGFAGESWDENSTLGSFGRHVGIAFQLRDDELGVYGDPEVTGKPAGDDIREGKRTVLLAHTWAQANPAQQDTLSSLWGQADLSESQVDHIRTIIIDTGAQAALETQITQHSTQALGLIPQLSPERAIQELLEDYVHALTDRQY